MTLTRGALDVLIGAAYPNPPTPDRESIAAKTRVRNGRVQANASSAVGEVHALPVAQSMTVEVAGERLTVRNEIVAITGGRAPQHLLVIPPGATLVDSRLIRVAPELRDLDRLPGNE